MKGEKYFSEESFKTPVELRVHNDRDWFLKNKERYESAVRDPFLRLIADLAPALYLHLEPANCAIGAGMWHPEPGPLKQIRDAIVADPKRWQKITTGKEFGSSC